MKQPWIQNAKIDGVFILLPPFLVLAIIFLFQNQIQGLENHYSFYTWLFLIVFVDVAHVYSTLFKTYFVKSEFQKKKLLYLGIPVISLVLGIVLYQFGSLLFWSALALVAVFHFVRQQYGFMRLYARFEPNSYFKILDSLAIYSATIYPMIFWFFTPRNFSWFVENEFIWAQNIPNFLPLFTKIYYLILVIWFIKTMWIFLKNKEFNIPKNAMIIGTYLSWYFGIVYFNNDLIFTLLNVISHGVPYIALIYIREIAQKDSTSLKNLSIFKTSLGIIFFVLVIIGFAFFEEMIWEIAVWKEHFSIQNFQIPEFYFPFIIPFLAIPQLTHYLLDGFIWRRPKNKLNS
jgi:hypothetical protein